MNCLTKKDVRASEVFYSDYQLCVSNDGSNVKVSLYDIKGVPTGGPGGWYKADWEMRLQEKVTHSDGTYSWNTVGSRTGWVNDESPSHRTFTNVRSTKYRTRHMRIYVNFTGGNGFIMIEFWR